MAAPEHRRIPPVLGYFRQALDGIRFQPTMEPPNRVPQGRFSSPIADTDHGTLLGCRHGLVLIFHSSKDQVLVWDPVTGVQRRFATPLGFDVHRTPFDGAVVRAAGDHFQVVLVGYKKKNPRAVVCIYSSETGLWSDLISTPVPRGAVQYQGMPAVLVGDSLYWLCSSVILKVDLCRQSLAAIQVPADMLAEDKYLMVMQAEGGGLGLLSLSGYTAQLWRRNTDAGGVSSWVLGRTIDLGRLLTLDSKRESRYMQMIGYAEENNVAFLRTVVGIFMVQLATFEFKKLLENNNCVVCYPLESVDASDSAASPMSAQAGEMAAPEHFPLPPVLGYFREALDGIHFQPTMDPPNRVPHGRFSSPIADGDHGTLLGCRHGLVLIFHSSKDQVLVWDPVTGHERRFSTPLGFDVHQPPFDGAVVRAARDHFQVVLVDYKQKNPRAVVCIYSSETGLWSDLISTPVPRGAVQYQGMPTVLVGDSLYCLSSSVILKVDLCRQSLAVIQVPADMLAEDKYLMVMRAEGGGLGLLSLSGYTAQLWRRNTDAGGVSSWVLGRTIDLGRLLTLDSKRESRYMQMIGYAEENNVAFLRTVAGIFMVQLATFEFKLLENNNCAVCYPLESVDAAETSICGGHDALDLIASPTSTQAVDEMAAPEHRRIPPVLGYFRQALDGIRFQPTMEPPNRVPHGRFSSPIGDGDHGTLLGCRHGLALIFHSSKDQVLLWDPVTGHERRFSTPLGFDVHQTPFDGAVVRAARDHFQVVLVGYKKKNPRAVVCIYSSETGLWSDLISTPVPRGAVQYQGMPAVLVGDSLYWLSSSVILKVDLCRQSLAVIQVPAHMLAEDKYLMVMRAEGGGLGLLSLSGYTAQLWKRYTNADGVSSWVLGRTIDLGRLLTLDSKRESRYMQMIGYAEENNVAVLRTVAGIYMVQLATFEFKKLLENNNCVVCYPLESVYAADSAASPMSAQAGEMAAPEHCPLPPVLGYFREALDGIHFQPTMEPPNLVPHGRFSSPIGDGDHGTLLGCRHGLVLIFHSSKDQVLVWDPVTGDQRRFSTPLGFDVHQTPFDGAVVRAAGDHFQVVLVGYKQKNPRAVVCIYSSETGLWSDLISTPVPRGAVQYQGMPAVLVGDSLYWLSSSVILKVDLCRQSLAVIQVPADMLAEDKYLMVMRAEGGGLGLLSLSGYTAQLWKRNTNADGVSSWVLGRTIDLGRLLTLDSKRGSRYMQMIGYAEENNVAFLRTVAGIFMVQLATFEFKKLLENNNCVVCYPLESVYAAETSIGGGHDGADQHMLM